MQKSLLAIFFSILSLTSIEAQQPQKLTSLEIYNAIKKLNFLGAVLYVAAHPDDENTRLISYMSNEVKARTAYLSLTRGGGGQNLVGSEIRELLGVIRTQELLAARRTDGGEQMFTRANDFGYSKHPDETLAIWNKKEVLSDVVWAIRKFQPDIIINRFNHKTPGSTHGHHTSSALLSVEAFDMAFDKKVYPEQLKHVAVWQPKRLFFNTSWWFYGSKKKFEKADKSTLFSLDTGIYYPELGLSNTEIASLSRSKHKSQGFGSTGTRGVQKEYLELVKGEFSANETNIFEGIDTSWNRIKGGKAIGDTIHKIAMNFDFLNPAASIPQLVSTYQMIQLLDNQHWKTIKSEEIKEIIAAVAGLYLEAISVESSATKNSNTTIKTEAINRSAATMKLKSIEIPNLNINETIEINLEQNIKKENEFIGKIDDDAPYTTPYWLQEKGTLGMYSVSDQKIIGSPETTPHIQAIFTIEIHGTTIQYQKNIVYKINDPVKGEVYKPFVITPEISVSLPDKVIIFADGASKKIPVTITSKSDHIKGSLALDIPDDWKVSPANVAFSIDQKGEEKSTMFTVTPPEEQSKGYIRPKVISKGQTFTNDMITINYDHIPTQTVLLPSEAKVVRLEIEKKGQNIGYIEGTGDIVPESLRQIGYTVTIIEPSSISETTLKPFDAIVVGIRAYNTVETLKYKQRYLLEYVKNGGNLIIQYNTSHRLKVTDNLGPYPIKLSRDRVTDEHATIKMLAKEHPVLNTPNKITDQDFNGWVQERGLYFPDTWSNKYEAIIATNDKGESQKKGALLIAKYGKGYYVYTGLSFFREFPAGVSGAYRLFANMLSLGK